MDLMLFLQAFLALLFVLGLVLVVFWGMKWCEQKGCKVPFFKKLNEETKLSVIESKRLDTRNTLALIRCDDKEYLVLLGASQNLVLNVKEIQKNA